MALSRRTGKRFEANIWPGFVDAMTALLLVLILSIFMILLFMFRGTIVSQDTELDKLSNQVKSLAQSLGLEQSKGRSLSSKVAGLSGLLDKSSLELEKQKTLVQSLTLEVGSQQSSIVDFEQQVLGLLSEKENSLQRIRALNQKLSSVSKDLELQISAKEAFSLALSQAREELDVGVEVARLAAARREALESLIMNLEIENDKNREEISDLEMQNLSDSAAAEMLKKRLAGADAELTAMTLTLEEKRRQAEETLTLLAATNFDYDILNEKLIAALVQVDEQRKEKLTLEGKVISAVTYVEKLELEGSAREKEIRDQLARLLAQKILTEQKLTVEISKSEQDQILLSTARAELKKEQSLGLKSQLLVEALNQQLAEVRSQLGQLQGLLDDSRARDEAAGVQLQTFRGDLNAALARLAAEKKKYAAELEKENEALIAMAGERDRVLEELKQEKSLLKSSVLEQTKQLSELESNQIKLTSLNSELLAAQIKANEEEQKRVMLEEDIRERLEADKLKLQAEALELKNYRSEFFGELKKLLGAQKAIEIKGDRFVFAAEVLFSSGSADLSPLGTREITKVTEIILRVSTSIPSNINWVLRVDGHTDSDPISGNGQFKDNWELSQARALSVVRYMSESLGMPANRLVAAGFGEFQPVNTTGTDEGKSQNRRIEMKLTER
ncbi:MAG: peptidoglycan -binding protein [Proteobacteria bacterium]|nr:peptidoglycan -binding protein [Pseudomonadota bacterium]